MLLTFLFFFMRAATTTLVLDFDEFFDPGSQIADLVLPSVLAVAHKTAPPLLAIARRPV